MITPKSGSVIQPQQTFDGIWLQSITINAPTPTGKINASIRAVPFNSTNGSLAPSSMGKNIFIQDVEALAASSSYAANAMGAIMAFTQDYIISKSLF